MAKDKKKGKPSAAEDNGSDSEKALNEGLTSKISAAVSAIEGFFVRLVRNTFALVTLVVVVVIFTPFANYMAKPLNVEMELSEVDLIVVLGGGAYQNGVLTGASNERMLHGLRLFRSGLADKVIFVGASINDTYKKVSQTINDDSGEIVESGSTPDVVEAALMKVQAKGLGIPEGSLYTETKSLNTYENLKAVKEFMETNKLKDCLVVTSATHMYRAKRVYERLGMDCLPAPAPAYSKYVESSTGRLSLLMEVVWEYAALVLYKSFGYI